MISRLSKKRRKRSICELNWLLDSSHTACKDIKKISDFGVHLEAILSHFILMCVCVFSDINTSDLIIYIEMFSSLWFIGDVCENRAYCETSNFFEKKIQNGCINVGQSLGAWGFSFSNTLPTCVKIFVLYSSSQFCC